MDRSVDAGRPRRRDLQPVLLELRPVDFEQFDVDDHFGPRLVDGRDHAGGGGDAFRRVFDRHRVGGRDVGEMRRASSTMPQQVHRFLQVGVAQIERPDHFFFVLAPLGRRVGDDQDRVLRR